MKSEKQTAPEFNPVNFNEIPVSVTYPFLPGNPTFKFSFKMLMTAEEKEARQKFFAQSDELQEAGRHAYNVEMLKTLLTKKPENLPGFDEVFEESKTSISGMVKEMESESLKVAIEAYFTQPGDLFIKLAADALNLYTTVSQPLEFFR